MKKALFIDRDGTLIVEPPVDFQVDSLEKLEFIPAVFRNMYYIGHNLDFELVIEQYVLCPVLGWLVFADSTRDCHRLAPLSRSLGFLGTAGARRGRNRRYLRPGRSRGGRDAG